MGEPWTIKVEFHCHASTDRDTLQAFMEHQIGEVCDASLNEPKIVDFDASLDMTDVP